MKRDTGNPVVESKVSTTDDVKDDERAAYEADLLKEFDEEISKIVDKFRKPYDASKEKKPKLAAYQPSFKLAEQACEEIATETLNRLNASDYKDEDIKYIVRDFELRGKILQRSRQRVGLIGDSGVGKSSLINSLLDTSDLALEVQPKRPVPNTEANKNLQSGTGGACTQVITEFRDVWPDQKMPLRAEIHFLTPSKRMEILKEHFANLYKLRIRPTKNSEEDTEDDDEVRCTTADDFFAALFADRVEFAKDGQFEQDLITTFFDSAKAADDDSILEPLNKWMEELLKRYVGQGPTARREAETAEELTLEMEPFITAVDANEPGFGSPSLWPIVHYIEVGLTSPLLKEGLIIADLPGLSDVNKIRKSTTERYMRTCQYLYVVSPISRVQTDENVHKRLMNKFGARGNQKTLICTKIDGDIDLVKTKPKALNPRLEVFEEHARLRQAFQIVDRQHKSLETRLSDLQGQVRKEATEELRTLRLRRKALETLGLASLVKMRNEKVRSAINGKFKKSTGNQVPPRMICVSNTAYSLHKRGYTKDNVPLPIEDTGIPKLRFEVLAVPAASRLNFVKTHVYGVLPSLLGILMCWSTAATIQKREEMRVIVAQPRESIDSVISKYVEDLKHTLQETIFKKISDRRYGFWRPAGKVAAEHWSRDYKAPQFKAWCKNNGEHKTPRKRHHSWNADLLAIVQKDLIDEWHKFDKKMEEMGTATAESLTSLVEGIRLGVREIPGLSTGAVEPFCQTLTPKKTLIAASFDHLSAEIRRTSDTIKVIATTDNEDGYLKKSMQPIYAAAAQEMGSGSYQQRIKVIGDAMSQGIPFSEIEAGIRNAFHKAFEKKRTRIVREVMKIFDGILKDFDIGFVLEEIPNPERDALRDEMKQFVTASKAKLDKYIAVELARAEGTSDH